MSQLEFAEKDLEAIRKEFAPGSTDSQFQVFIRECQNRALEPGRHIVFQLRSSKEWDADTKSAQYVQKPIYITTIAAMRLIAQRTGKYVGQGREKYIYLDADGNPTIESSIPLPDPKNKSQAREPWVAEATVYREGFKEPMVGVARFEAYAATQKSANGGFVLTRTWQQRNCEMLSKCAEALALRKAFPEELSGLLLADELKPDAEDLPVQSVTPASILPPPSLPSVPKVDQTPVEGKSEPRPGESQYKSVEIEDTIPTPPDGRAPDRVLTVVKVPVEPETSANPPAKRGRKPKENPVNGQTSAPEPRTQNENSRTQIEDGITDEDLDHLGTPAPLVDKERLRKEAEEFVEGTDPTPTDEEIKAFTVRIRALAGKNIPSGPIKVRMLDLAGFDKDADYKKVPKRYWEQAISEKETQL